MEISGISRIEIINGRYFPQVKIKSKWINILSNKWDGKWYEAPKFNGYGDRINAEIILEWCNERLILENRIRKINKIKNKNKIKRYVITIFQKTFKNSRRRTRII